MNSSFGEKWRSALKMEMASLETEKDGLKVDEVGGRWKDWSFERVRMDVWKKATSLVGARGKVVLGGREHG